MGLLVNGQWHTDWYDTESNDGRFIREDAQFRHWITKDGQAGPTGQSSFNAEAGRYHLYVSLACPWAHRTLLFRKLKGLEDIISVSVVDPYMGDEGWTFKSGGGVSADTINHKTHMHEIYTLAVPNYSGRVTVPVLWDKKNHTIVNNESSEIIRILNTAFDDMGAKAGDYYPENKRQQIDSINHLVYNAINNGVYRAGFATHQDAYEEAVCDIFDALEKVEHHLNQQLYLVGNNTTEADWRLFTTLIRFDAVYFGHFKCNKKRIIDYPALSNYLRDLYQFPGIAETVNMSHIKNHYYTSHPTINPTGIVPIGPILDFEQAHDRNKFNN